MEIDLNSNVTLNKSYQIALIKIQQSYTEDFQGQSILQVLLLLYSFKSGRFRLVILSLLPQESHGVNSAPVWRSTVRQSSWAELSQLVSAVYWLQEPKFSLSYVCRSAKLLTPTKWIQTESWWRLNWQKESYSYKRPCRWPLFCPCCWFVHCLFAIYCPHAS